MRLGDLDALFCRFWGKADPFKEQPLVRPCVVWSDAATMAREAPAIDPEALPIVRQLREELARVTAERDAAQRLLAEHTGVVGMEKVTTCFGYPLDKVLELVLADRDGRLIIRQEKGKEARP